MTRRWMGWGALIAAAALGLTPPAPAADEMRVDAETFAGLEARAIGPATMSGRIAAIDAVREEFLTVWVGTASGGVWKSVNGGVTFKPVFDKHTQSIGALAVQRSRPATAWVGTGESCVRNSVSIGDGVYKTTDGGETWSRMGLEDAERVARIVIDPQRPDTVYVAATGRLWAPGGQRGVYRTRDGGGSWERVLFVNEDTGCADLAIDPGDPRILYAAMWDFRRQPWTFRSGGPGSGLYRSMDGGDTWTRLGHGLPAGDLGRIGLAVAPSSPNVVYAVVEAKKTALYRSTDRGDTWTEVNSSANIVFRPFYFAHLAVDPRNADRVYKPGLSLTVSEDGGQTFATAGGGVHPDHHALWIDDEDPNRLFLGTDGGVFVSENRGNHWRMLGSLPVSQFYHVSYDLDWPYNVYGGLQDNGSWSGPSRRPGGIANHHWRKLGGGDGFWAFVDPTEPDITYVEYQGGNLLRVRRSTGETKEIKPFRAEGEPDYRFNWNTPIHLSRRQPGTVYFAAQYLFRSRDRGENWERISPDLTTNDPARQRQHESGGLTVDNTTAENHCTIFAISESSLDGDVVWVGTDDGNVQLTRDGGRTWTNVGRRIPGLPAGTGVAGIEASHHDAGAAYVVFDGHATGDLRPHVYRVTDYGRRWQSLATATLRGYAHVVREDPVNPDLLFLGTELGLFVTLDGGRQWAQFRANLPDVAVRDLAIHPREADLIVGTHGRGIYIVDDISALRGVTPAVLAAEAAILPSQPSTLVLPAREQRYDGNAEFVGASIEDAAFVTYYLKKRHMFGDLRVEFYAPDGSLIRSLPGGKRRGINRVALPMRMAPPKVPPATSMTPQAFAFFGPRLAEGRYPVKLIRGSETLTSEIVLRPDPRSLHSVADRAAQREAVLRLYRMIESLAFVADAVADARKQVQAGSGRLPATDAARKRLAAFDDRLVALQKRLASTRDNRASGDQQLREKLGALYGAINGHEGRPTGSQLRGADVLDADVRRAQAEFEALAAELPAINTALARHAIEPIAALSRAAWEKRQQEEK